MFLFVLAYAGMGLTPLPILVYLKPTARSHSFRRPPATRSAILAHYLLVERLHVFGWLARAPLAPPSALPIVMAAGAHVHSCRAGPGLYPGRDLLLWPM